MLALLLGVSLPVVLGAVGSTDDSEELRILLGTEVGSLRVSGPDLQVSEASGPKALGPRRDFRSPFGAVTESRAWEEKSSRRPVAVHAGGTLRALGRSLRGRVEFQCDGDRWQAINVLPIGELSGGGAGRRDAGQLSD